MKRGPALVVLLVHIGSIFYQELHHVQVLINTGLREEGRGCPGGEGLKGKGREKKKGVGVKSNVQPSPAAGNFWVELPML